MSTIAGIDLGTTFSALARLNGIGRPEILPNNEGERITPSAVYFEEEEAGSIRVGLEAVNCRQLNPDRAVRNRTPVNALRYGDYAWAYSFTHGWRLAHRRSSAAGGCAGRAAGCSPGGKLRHHAARP